jgi:hypothetical protein
VEESCLNKRGVAGVAFNDVMSQGLLQIRECDCMTKLIRMTSLGRRWLMRFGVWLDTLASW